MNNTTLKLKLIVCATALASTGALIEVKPLAAAQAAAKPSLTATGWNQFWGNQNAAARTSFRAALKANPSDTSARRGLGWLALQDGARGDAVAAWLPLFTTAPGQPETAMLWPRFAVLCDMTGNYSAIQAAARSVIASKTASPAFRQAARATLSNELAMAGQKKAGAALLAGNGSVRRWKAVGPFSNVSRSGFSKIYEPERAPNTAKSYIAKDELALGWLSVNAASHGIDSQIRLAGMLGDGDPCVFYAATAIHAPSAGTATLFFDATGASKLMVNGRVLLSDEIDRSELAYGAEPFVLKTPLRAGWNTVLVKVADGDSTSARFSLRALGADGKPLAADPARTVPVALQRISPGHPGAEFNNHSSDTMAAAALVKQPLTAATAEKLMTLAYNQVQANDFEMADISLKALLAKYPQSGWLHFEASRALSASDQEDAAKVELEKAISLQPGLLDARLDRLDNEDDSLTASQKINALRALHKNHKRSARLFWKLASAYGEANMGAEMLKAARTATSMAPGASSLKLLADYYELDEQPSEQIAALQRGLKPYPFDVVLLEALAEVYEGQGKAKQALALYQRSLPMNINPASTLISMADLQMTLRDRAGAINSMRAARALRPQDAIIAARLASILHESGQKPAAVALLKESVRLQPTNSALRDRLQLWSGEKPVLDLVPATAAGPILAKAAKLQTKGGAPVVVLLDEGRQAVYPDYATVARYRTIAKVFNAAGAAQFSEFSLNRTTSEDSITVESARIIKADGTVQEADESEDDNKVLFPSLAPGDVIDVSHRLESRQSGSLARSFWLNWTFSMPEIPVLQSRFVLVTPEAMTFATQQRGLVPQPRVRKAGRWSVREWALRDIPATQPEMSAPAPAEWQSSLDISSVPSWSKISSWYRDISGPLTVPDATVRAKAAELTRNAKTENEKLRAIVRFVSSIQYQSTPFRLSAFVPTPGKQVLRERYGDCKDKAALLSALLKAVGIRSDIVLLTTRDAGIHSYLPSPRFNHAIARVMTQSGELWVDATADKLEFGNLPMGDQGVPALIVNDDTTGLTTSPVLPSGMDRSEEASQVSLDADGRLEGEMTVTSTGTLAWMLRSAVSEVGESERTQLLKTIVSRLIDKSRYLSGSFSGLDNPDSPLGMKMSYSVDSFGKKAGGFMLVSLPWGVGRNFDALRADGKRTLDVEMANYRAVVHRSVTIKLPQGYEPQELPPNIVKDSPWGSYRFDYELKNGVLKASSELVNKNLRIPAAEVKDYADWAEAYSTESQRQIVLKKP